MTTHWNDLQVLTNIVDTFKPPPIVKFNDTKQIDDVKETLDIFIDEYIRSNVKEYKDYHFEEVLFKYISEIFDDIFCSTLLDDDVDIYQLIKDSIYFHFMRNKNPRSYCDTRIIDNVDKKRVDKLFEYYKTKEQPDQRTDEWYQFRYNGLTASSIYKSFDSQANINSIIYDKCKPLKKHHGVNIDSPFHNGHKYEPLSILIYETIHNTKVEEFGCITHKEHKFIRASPDGINTKRDNPRYGRMLEVKNPVSREITGIPKKAYWVQMQIQMEVWDLNECDFLETSFKEYDNENDFLEDGDVWNYTRDNKRKGAIIMINDGSEPEYIYAPIDFDNKKDWDEWEENYLNNMDEKYSWIKTIYWKLDTYSCVLVPRNKYWFAAVFPQIKDCWDNIVKERVTGYDHRKPKKKTKKKKKLTPNSLQKLHENTKELGLQNNSSIENGTVVIKIRTQSFSDETSQQPST